MKTSCGASCPKTTQENQVIKGNQLLDSQTPVGPLMQDLFLKVLSEF